MENGCLEPMLAIKFLSQIDSFATLNAAVSLALQEEVAMVFCFLAVQEMRPDLSVNPYPPTLLLVSRQLVSPVGICGTNKSNGSVTTKGQLNVPSPFEVSDHSECCIPVGIHI